MPVQIRYQVTKIASTSQESEVGITAAWIGQQIAIGYCASRLATIMKLFNDCTLIINHLGYQFKTRLLGQLESSES